MLINTEKSNTVSHVQFMSYSGKWPYLCDGILVLNIDGINIKFGNRYVDDTVQYPKFWQSGGRATPDIEKKEWLIDVNKIPEKFRKYAVEIDQVFNDNVEHGCCGGCR